MMRFGCMSCRIALVAHERDRGTIGFCPQCRTPYVVPRDQNDPAFAIQVVQPLLSQSSKIGLAVSLGFALVLVLFAVFFYRINPARRAVAPPPRQSAPVPVQPTVPDLAVFDPPPALLSTDPVSWKPEKVIPAEDIFINGELVDDTLYVGATDGTINAIDIHTLKVQSRRLGERFM
jgi:hypothetical protein